MGAELLLWGGLLLVVLGIGLAAYAAIGSGSRGVARSLALIEDQVSRNEVATHELDASERLFMPLRDLARRVGGRLAPSSTITRMTRNLELAGNPPGWTVDRILTIKAVGLVVGLLVGLLFVAGGLTGVLALLGCMVGGFFLPDVLVYNSAVKRQENLRLGLADALDLLTLCVEAGQAFNAALLQVSRSVGGPVSAELGRVLAEIQIGKSRADAFADLASRTTAAEIRTFVTALTQADRLGVPLGAVLREQAKEMRVIRRQMAEEKAQKVPVKILFPMLFFVFPALFIVLLGPGAIQIMKSFSSL
jgi:tight adherence protein C